MLLEEFALSVTIEVPKFFWNVLTKGGVLFLIILLGFFPS